MRSLLLAIGVCSINAAVILAAASSFCSAADMGTDAANIKPELTKVLLLSPIDATEAAATAGPVRRQIMRIRQQREFISRHFTVLGEAAAAKACAMQPGVNVESLSDRTAEVLDKLATRVGADWIVSIAVRDIAVDDLDPPNVSIWFVRCTVRLQIRDARHREWLANRSYTGRIFAGGPPPELFLDALDTTTEQALASLLWPFTVIVPVSRDGRIVDYLNGAVEPVRARPGSIFSGWKPDESAK